MDTRCFLNTLGNSFECFMHVQNDHFVINTMSYLFMKQGSLSCFGTLEFPKPQCSWYL